MTNYVFLLIENKKKVGKSILNKIQFNKNYKKVVSKTTSFLPERYRKTF